MAARTCEHCGRDLGSGQQTACPYCRRTQENIGNVESSTSRVVSPAGNEVADLQPTSLVAESVPVNNQGPVSHGDFRVTGWRIVGALVDFIPLTILFFVMAIFLGEAAMGGGSFNVNLDGWPFLIFLGLAVVYYTTMEAVTGTTLGKMLLGLKVVKTDGGRYSLKSVLIRNLFRIIDGLPALYLSGLVTIGVTTWKQRLGDLAAGTQVVRVLPNPQATSNDINLQGSAELLVPTDARWKRSVMPRMAFSLLIIAVIIGLAIYVTPAGMTQSPTGIIQSVPGEEDLKLLVTNTFREFDSGIQANSMTIFWDSFSELAKSKITPSELGEAFQLFLDSEEFSGAINKVEGVEPVFDQPPAIDDRALVLSGYYPTTPLTVRFRLVYVYEHPQWKLLGIDVNIGSGRPP